MAEPISFDEGNTVFGLLTSDHDGSLACYSTPPDDPEPMMVTCWKLNSEEYKEVVKTGRVWVMMYADTAPPFAVCGLKPIERVPPDQEDEDDDGS